MHIVKKNKRHSRAEGLINTTFILQCSLKRRIKIIEKKDYRDSEVVAYLQFCTDNITTLTIFYLLKIQNLISGKISLQSSSNSVHDS